jgi:hypothetical protein
LDTKDKYEYPYLALIKSLPKYVIPVIVIWVILGVIFRFSPSFPRLFFQLTGKHLIEKLPQSELSKIEGRGSIDKVFEGFKAKIYNGSDYTITDITIRIVVKGKNGKVKWDRLFRVSKEIPSLSVSEISFPLLGVEWDIPSFDWYIEEARGYLEKRE